MEEEGEREKKGDEVKGGIRKVGDNKREERKGRKVRTANEKEENIFSPLNV